jgi:DHA2 family lincomycin resistance protein-like MFS transporter
MAYRSVIIRCVGDRDEEDDRTESIELHPRVATAPRRTSGADRTVIGVLLVATFVVILNETIMAVALPTLITDSDAERGPVVTAGFLSMLAIIRSSASDPRVPTRTLYGVAWGCSAAHALALAPGSPCCAASCRPAARRSCC